MASCAVKIGLPYYPLPPRPLIGAQLGEAKIRGEEGIERELFGILEDPFPFRFFFLLEAGAGELPLL